MYQRVNSLPAAKVVPQAPTHHPQIDQNLQFLQRLEQPSHSRGLSSYNRKSAARQKLRHYSPTLEY